MGINPGCGYDKRVRTVLACTYNSTVNIIWEIVYVENEIKWTEPWGTPESTGLESLA